MRQTGAIIDGDRVHTAAEVAVVDPSTAQIIAITADCGPAEVDQAVQAAQNALPTWRRTAVEDRARLLRRLSILIARDHEDLSRMESTQTGKPLRQAQRDVEITVRYFDFYASAIETFYGTTIPMNDGNLIYTTWEPHGVTGHIIPWNYPLQILGRSIAAALAMGNCCVLKPAEETPLTALRIAELALEAGFPKGALNVVTGYGESTGAALTAHPGINHISFTGSVEVGRIISRAAADRTIPVTMELGGKSPNIVFADADLDKAVPVIANSILQNAGQTCSAGSRLLVHKDIHVDLVHRLVDFFAKVEIGPALEDPMLGPLISENQRARVLGFTDWAKENASVVFGGDALSGGRFGDGFFVQPTLIDNVDPASILGQEEVFGPVLAVTPFNSIEHAVELANGTDFGLIAGVWTTDLSTALRMTKDVIAGQIFVNTYGASGGVELPFGGFKRSGHGREKGAEGLRGFGQVKTAIIAL